MFFSSSKSSALSSSSTEHSHLSLSHSHSADGEDRDSWPCGSPPPQIWQKMKCIKTCATCQPLDYPRARPYSLDTSRERNFNPAGEWPVKSSSRTFRPAAFLWEPPERGIAGASPAVPPLNLARRVLMAGAIAPDSSFWSTLQRTPAAGKHPGFWDDPYPIRQHSPGTGLGVAHCYEFCFCALL